MDLIHNNTERWDVKQTGLQARRLTGSRGLLHLFFLAPPSKEMKRRSVDQSLNTFSQTDDRKHLGVSAQSTPTQRLLQWKNCQAKEGERIQGRIIKHHERLEVDHRACSRNEVLNYEDPKLLLHSKDKTRVSSEATGIWGNAGSKVWRRRVVRLEEGFKTQFLSPEQGVGMLGVLFLHSVEWRATEGINSPKHWEWGRGWTMTDYYCLTA